MTSRFGIVRSFDYEGPIEAEALPDLCAKVCFVEIDGEQFIEIKTLGPKEKDYNSDDVQVIRLTKRAIDEIVAQWKTFA